MACNLCPRQCEAERKNGERGFCGMTEEVMVARVAPHYWEEPCLSGEAGSGTVFFSGCNLRCVYCQNHKIAAGRTGKPMSIRELSAAFLSLQEMGCHNINLVTPSHYIPQIREALCQAKLTVPVVYNTSSYECVQSLRQMEGLVDIYLADLKYLDAGLAKKYSHAADYPETAKAAIAEMVRQVGGITYVCETEGDEREKSSRKSAMDPDLKEIRNATEYPDGALMKRGVIVRHLLLPGQVEEAKRVLRYLYETYGDTIAVSILNQYTPLPHVEAYPELNRTVTEEEYEEVVEYALELGIGHGFLQDGQAVGESFIPEFE
ncbi:MAG: radical SAM protein [Lachnospiraceae bacterium]|nr:radical SAM protein [Lachnospiraceae bacterium]